MVPLEKQNFVSPQNILMAWLENKKNSSFHDNLKKKKIAFKLFSIFTVKKWTPNKRLQNHPVRNTTRVYYHSGRAMRLERVPVDFQ